MLRAPPEDNCIDFFFVTDIPLATNEDLMTILQGSDKNISIVMTLMKILKPRPVSGGTGTLNKCILSNDDLQITLLIWPNAIDLFRDLMREGNVSF